MISDVCSDAVAEIDHYLADPVYAGVYTGEMLARIIRVRDALEQLQLDLDRPPLPELERQAAVRKFFPGGFKRRG